ncbi:hypothetical protein [Escherichia coli]|uniref:hypothetical protein n=1 Tax=Escherichia coli TaxID=562 RepID=UPI001BFCEB9E|nr:hypothetical protein [Escherichia coli]HBB2114865.1 hypothetical protein [Escherichia coli]
MINYAVTAKNTIDQTYYHVAADRLIAMYLADCQYHNMDHVVMRIDNLLKLAWLCGLTREELYRKLKDGVYPYFPEYCGPYSGVKDEQAKEIIDIKQDKPTNGEHDYFFVLKLHIDKNFYKKYMLRTSPF